MSKRRQPPRRPGLPRERLAAFVALAASVLGVLWVVAARPPIGVPGQHVYPYHPEPPWLAIGPLALLALPVLVVWGVLLGWKRPFGRRLELLLVVGLTAGSLVLHAATAVASKAYVGAELGWPFLWLNTEGAYAHYAHEAAHAADFVSNAWHWLDVSPERGSPHWVHVHHPQVHPPGLILGFVALDAVYDGCPSLAKAVEDFAVRTLPSSIVLRQEGPGIGLDHPLAVSLTAAALVIFVAGLAPLACFLALRPLWPGRQALVAAGLTALVPGTHLFNPSVDQAYPTLTLLLCAAAARLLATRRRRWGFALGLLLYGVMFLHVGFALAAAVLGAFGLLAWRTERPEWGLRDVVAAYARPVGYVALGFLTPAFVLQVWLGYPTFRVIGMCLRNNALFNAAVGRTYWPWAVVVPFELAVSLGFALALAGGLGWLAEAGGAVRARSLRGRSALLLATGGLFLALVVLGVNRGEAARLWLFLTPFAVVAVADFAWRRAAEPRRAFAFLAAAQLVQLILFRIVLDPGRTTEFFLDYLTAH